VSFGCRVREDAGGGRAERSSGSADEAALRASHMGWLHMWRVAESDRLQQRPASITDDIVLARKYFQKAAATC